MAPTRRHPCFLLYGTRGKGGMTDEELMQDFEAGRLARWRDSITASTSASRGTTCASHPLPEALGRFCRGLRRFAESQGAPGLYHETITVAYLLLINERLSGHDDLEWDAFATLNQDLLAWKPSVLDRLYTPETLASDRARRVFVMPDRPGCGAGPVATPRPGSWRLKR